MSDTNKYENRLLELGGSDFEIADGQPNIKGWDVKDERGEYIGEVEELLFDPQSRKVRYIVLDLEGNAFDLDAREVLVPIGIAALHENDDDVILCGVSAEQLRSLPDYDDDSLNAETEHTIRNTFSGSTEAPVVASATASSVDFYAHDHFNETHLYKFRSREGAASANETSGSMNMQSNEDWNGFQLRSRSGESNVPDTDRREGMGEDSIANDVRNEDTRMRNTGSDMNTILNKDDEDSDSNRKSNSSIDQ